MACDSKTVVAVPGWSGAVAAARCVCHAAGETLWRAEEKAVGRARIKFRLTLMDQPVSIYKCTPSRSQQSFLFPCCPISEQ